MMELTKTTYMYTISQIWPFQTRVLDSSNLQSNFCEFGRITNKTLTTSSVPEVSIVAFLIKQTSIVNKQKLVKKPN